MGFKPPKTGKVYTGLKGHKLMPGEDTVDDRQVNKCRRCARRIAWLTSNRGKKYPVNVSGERSMSNRLIIRRNDFHNCEG